MSCTADREICKHRKTPVTEHCLVKQCENYYGSCQEHKAVVGGTR